MKTERTRVVRAFERALHSAYDATSGVFWTVDETERVTQLARNLIREMEWRRAAAESKPSFFNQ